MSHPLEDWHWLDASETVSLSELSRACALETAQLMELMEYGALAFLPPTRPEQPERLFSAQCIPPLRIAAKLQRDFDLDLFAVALLLEYLNRIDTLEQQLHALQAQRA